MSGQHVPDTEIPLSPGSTVALVGTFWNAKLVDRMIESARKTLTESECESVVVRVAGAGDLPYAAQVAARSSYDAVIAFGVVIRGGTDHYATVIDRVTTGLARVQLDESKPVVDCVLAVHDEVSAVARAGGSGSREDKGRQAAQAALVSLWAAKELRDEAP